MAVLKPGDPAPYFSGIDQDENIISLCDYKGSKLVVYFYPKANTPGCTAESCSLSDNYDSLLSKGYKVVGVSADSVKSQKNFADKYSLRFSLLADTDKVIIKAYGAWGTKKMYGREYEGIMRYTFLIDEQGIITDVIEKVDTKNHAKQILG
ncbi:MAG TPA: thioredoxin-dependent thiol peroxidase [Bacteroidales bacterium]|nr:MAG: peroxiredoxin [Bacteroidetes bacterium GWE2_42_24]OFY29481.1 MAG: peroxiredoxin [Bacteroidetes bacterium GWF2_43_11]PKP27799.1 MAG: thioredoxin-dependent thiol peroxidase [Bacteroidetes bacterium HGW-Bacteroidetes-22]HAQ64680.1 thioredoxin-dependent thiol peroxidase [Bacteroidales bacterium]HBZ67275.1 thioredoxin-dependent thiol peroxidase [Bacteroidales bacterium]